MYVYEAAIIVAEKPFANHKNVAVHNWIRSRLVNDWLIW